MITEATLAIGNLPLSLGLLGGGNLCPHLVVGHCTCQLYDQVNQPRFRGEEFNCSVILPEQLPLLLLAVPPRFIGNPPCLPKYLPLTATKEYVSLLLIRL
ncbi:hypothetical protein KGM_206575 [Danaus plexippus plexippus]|uniref:Uncharacterized protein n=1 Tax=Danaus plexippus plexippus TaxID=278856 RepID=A0A212FHW7_DANPL|nr:hypothetical protein KGM_206575 [Danaus plexippus plexippus]